MKNRIGDWLIRAVVSLATLLLGCLLFLLVAWTLALLGLPPSLSWLVLILGPIVVGRVYILVSFTRLGKYLWDLSPGSLG